MARAGPPGARLLAFNRGFAMSIRHHLVASTALALLAGAAQAQVTADDVWAGLVAQYGALGVDLTGNVTRDGAIVTVSGIEGSMMLPMVEGTVLVATGDLLMTESADGAVDITLPATWPVTLSIHATDQGETLAAVADVFVATQGYAARYLGTPDDLRATSSYDRMLITLERLTVALSGEALPLDVDMLLALEGAETQSRILRQGDVEVQSDGTLARLVVDYSFSIDDMLSHTVSETRDMRYLSRMIVPAGGFDVLNLAPALRAGLDLTASFQSGRLQSQAVSRMGETTISDTFQTVETAQQTLELNADGIAVGGESTGIDVQLTLTDLVPGPLGLTLARAAGAFRMPLLAGQGPAPAGFSLDLAGLALSDGVWDMIGPGTGPLRQLGHLSLDLAAEVTPRVDLIDLIGLQALMDGYDSIPLELNSVTLNSFRAAYAGAEVTGSGAAQLVWAGLDRLYEVEEPTGSATFVTTGMVGLLDLLSGAGLLGPQEMLGLRGGLAIVGRPTGVDTLTTDITFGPGIGLVVNGQKLD